MTEDKMQFFEPGEFACLCCGRTRLNPKFKDKIDTARLYAKVPFVITSGCRCEKHNKVVGGKPTSSHLIDNHIGGCCAADIRTATSVERFRVLYGLIQARFLRIGIGKDFIHADCDEEKDVGVMWMY